MEDEEQVPETRDPSCTVACSARRGARAARVGELAAQDLQPHAGGGHHLDRVVVDVRGDPPPLLLLGRDEVAARRASPPGDGRRPRASRSATTSGRARWPRPPRSSTGPSPRGGSHRRSPGRGALDDVADRPGAEHLEHVRAVARTPRARSRWSRRDRRRSRWPRAAPPPAGMRTSSSATSGLIACARSIASSRIGGRARELEPGLGADEIAERIVRAAPRPPRPGRGWETSSAIRLPPGTIARTIAGLHLLSTLFRGICRNGRRAGDASAG